MKLKKLAAIMGLGLGLAVAAVPASADLYSFEDDDIDFILRGTTVNGVTTYAPIQSGTLATGDIFFAVFEIPEFTINGVNAIPAGQELTGVAAVQLVTVVGSGGAGTQYIFGPSSVAIDSFAAYQGPDLADGAAIAMFFNGTSGADGDRDLELNRTLLPATNCTSFADCLTQATLGDLFQVDGFAGDGDEFWVSTQILAGGGDIATVLATNNGVLISGFNAALSNLFQAGATVGFIDLATGNDCGNPGVQAVADGCAQISLSGTVTGGQGLVNGAIAHSDFDAQKYTVPEPASLALLGIGLMGLGAMRRRRS